MNANSPEHSHDESDGRPMTGTNLGAGNHDEWDELAVGYALTALEPDELDRFFEHLLESCALCRQSVDDTAAIGAQLGSATIRSVEHVSDDLRQRVLQAALESRPAVPQSPAGLPAPTDLPASLRRDADAGAPVADLAERRNRRLRVSEPRTGWFVAAAAAVVALVLSVTTVAALHGQRQQRSLADASRSAISAIVAGGSASVVPLRNDAGDNIATVVARADNISVVSQNLTANSASTSYVLWGIAKGTNSAPTALGVFDVRGDKVQAMQVGSDSRGAYTDFKTYAISHEPGHTAPSRPSQIVALGNV